MYHKRKYTPVHTEKYAGDPTNIIMRSSWETKFAIWCDHNPSIIQWVSEEIVIPYICPTDNRAHRYFVDFVIKVRERSGAIKTYLVEIKPDAQTRPPIKPSKTTRRYLTEVMAYGKNQAKWTAATEYARRRGWEFKVLTEYDLGLAKRNK
jgi:hypothetical protein